MYCIKLCFNFHLSSFSEKCGEVIQVFIISYLSIWCTFENVLLQTVDAYHLILLVCICIKRHQPTHVRSLLSAHFVALGTRLFKETVPNNLSSATRIFKRLIILQNTLKHRLVQCHHLTLVFILNIPHPYLQKIEMRNIFSFFNFDDDN